MTQRERQILNWIEENPLISQQELAEKAGITRSSVAVHISNLMKKGYITGKGYIVHTAPYVTVVGGVNMDIGGWPSEVLVDRDSNPGAVRMSLGGVGRNIAHNMSLLGLDVRMVTAFGDDLYAQKIAASCGELGIDISQSPVIPEGHTSTYLFINDEKGDMLLAVSDMDIYRHLTPQLLSQRQKLLSGSQVLVIDTNIPAESIAYLAENCPVRLLIGPQGPFCQSGELMEPFIHHIPHTHGQVIPVTTVQRHALKAVAVVRAGLLAGAVVTALPHLLQKFPLDGHGFRMAALPVQLVLLNCKFIAIDLHVSASSSNVKT